MDDDVVMTTVVPKTDTLTQWKIRDLLTRAGLGYDEDIEVFVVAKRGRDVVGCLGLAGNVVKCAAIDPDFQGHNLAGRMMTEIHYLALERRRAHLFLFTKPKNVELFEGCGFHLLASVPDKAVLMENNPRGIEHYAAALAADKVAGERISGIVMNANPFTRGHQYLIRTAAQESDVVHVFVVREDVSMFPYADRLRLVREGVALIPERHKVIVHPGSPYIVSRATFPSYFLKDKADLTKAATGIDLQLFRRYIAPALGIRHRYVGAEPTSAVTNLYNQDMHYWLEETPLPAPPIEVHTLSRIGTLGVPFISATQVRDLIAARDLDALERLVPAPTLNLIEDKYLAGAGAGLT